MLTGPTRQKVLQQRESNHSILHGSVVNCCCFLVHKLCPTLLWPHGLYTISLLCSWDFPGKNTKVGCHFLLHGIFPTQGSNPCTCIDRWILYHWATRLGLWNTYTHTHTHTHTHNGILLSHKKEWNHLIYCFKNAHLFTEIVTAGFLFAITYKYFLIISLKKE